MWWMIRRWLRQVQLNRKANDRFLLRDAVHEDDRVLMKRVLERMRWDQRVSIVDIKIKIQEGYVTLTGEVDSNFRRGAALELVGHTEGIQGYQDDIVVVAGYTRSDTDLATIIKEQLAAISLMPGEEISARVVDGTVCLRGVVYRSRPKANAAGMVWALSGVRDCINLVEVAEPPRDKVTTIPVSDRSRLRSTGLAESYVSH